MNICTKSLSSNTIFAFSPFFLDLSLIKSFDNKLYCLVNRIYYRLIELDSHERKSREFDSIKPEVRKKYTVPANHPWKEQSYLNMLARTAYKQR